MTQLLTPKLSGVRFCCFHGEKCELTQKLFVFPRNSYKTFTEPVLLRTAAIGIRTIHASSCLHGYSDSYSYQCERGLTVEKHRCQIKCLRPDGLHWKPRTEHEEVSASMQPPRPRTNFVGCCSWV